MAKKYRNRKGIKGWADRNGFIILLVLIAIIILSALAFFGQELQKNDMEQVKSNMALMETTARDIYSIYVKEGHSGTLKEDPKPYHELQAKYLHLRGSIEDYRENAQEGILKRKVVLMHEVKILTEDFLDILKEHKELEGYQVTTQQRRELAEALEEL